MCREDYYYASISAYDRAAVFYVWNEKVAQFSGCHYCYNHYANVVDDVQTTLADQQCYT